MKTYKVTLNEQQGDFLVWVPGSYSGKVRAINADHAVRIVAEQLYPQREQHIGKVLMATHKSGDRATIEVGRV